MALPGIDKVHNVSIIPLFIGARCSTIPCPTEHRLLMTEAELRNQSAGFMTSGVASSDSNAPQ
jgi:ATP-dependent Zn protease